MYVKKKSLFSVQNLATKKGIVNRKIKHVEETIFCAHSFKIPLGNTCQKKRLHIH